ncbi:MAG: ABC transporter ATP-binding protein [Betaproteobacteria bacterium]|nr:ABC transporter ATP-binding protein [Betaproteobacteria bacterium]
MTAQALLQVRHLHKSFGSQMAVNNVSFDVGAGELLAVIGPNGAGKSTTFNLVNGQLSPDSGSVSLNGQSLIGRKPHDLWRQGVSRTFQMAEVFRSMSVIENVQMAMLSAQGLQFSPWRRTRQHRADAAQILLEKVGLADMSQHISDTLAYGDIKRLELAMALVNQPRLLLMDEPTAGMSPSERHALMGLVQFLAKERDVAVMFTEHSMDMVFSFATRILVMAQGRILVEGTPQEVQNNPLAQSVYLGRGKTLEGETI